MKTEYTYEQLSTLILQLQEEIKTLNEELHGLRVENSTFFEKLLKQLKIISRLICE